MDNLQTQIDNLKTLQESYSQLGAAAEAYNVGKVQLAQNITSKGVQASADETLPELAEKVATISQETLQIDGGEMYAKQLFGSLETPNFWNLYDILAQLLSDGRLVNYGGILLAEYYKGYDSLALSGAGSGGAYVVSDKDANGQFIMYTNDTTHVWATEFDGKINRWVAYCFADEYHDFQITNTNTSPRSIFIGRKVGTISLLANSRCEQITIMDGSTLRAFDKGSYTQSWASKIILRNIENITKELAYNQSGIQSIYLNADSVSTGVYKCDTDAAQGLREVVICANSITGGFIDSRTQYSVWGNLKMIVAKAPTINAAVSSNWGGFNNATGLLLAIISESATVNVSALAPYTNQSHKYFFGYITNDKTKSVSVTSTNSANARALDLELQDGWCKPLSVPNCTQLTESQIYSHILQKLKHDEAGCGTGVTITLGSSVLAKLVSEESQALLAELRGTYGYTFA